MKSNLKPILMLAIAATVVFSCKPQKKETVKASEHHGLDLQYMDTTVSPGQNFYKFVNGKWMAEAKIPADHSSWGSFQILNKNTNDTLLAMIGRLSKNNEYDPDSEQAKALAIYNTKLDTAARNKLGTKPLQPIMKKIAEVKDLKDLEKVILNYPVQIGNPFVGIYANAKFTDSDMMGGYLVPGSLGLPNRDYYMKTDSASRVLRKKYVDHITRMFSFMGVNKDEAHQKAETILALETKLAEPRMTKEERRDATKLNNPMSINEISKLTPAIDWNALIAKLPVKTKVDTLTVTQPAYMKALQGILTNTDIKDLKTLVSWATLNSAASQLTTDMEKANWDFYSKTLRGVKKQRPADKRALSTVNSTIGQALGKIYVDQYFPPEAKKKALTMVQNIIATYKVRINKLDWMTDSTKEKAIQKLNKLTIKIGYPDKWKDYSGMKISADSSYYDNMVAASLWNLTYNLSKINQPVDPTEWFMNPQTVNAYYSPSRNEIVFPAAILQPPFYDYKADAAVNYGGMGAVIGHEISHAFDDSGARFDADGNLHNWWTKEDKAKFKKRTQKLADFYSKVYVTDSLHLNGKYTLGENAADLGGVLASYNALQRYYKTHERPGKIGGFTQNQRFFISWATVWRTKMRPEARITQIKTNPHSPGRYRAYLPLENVDAFYKAFNIKKGDSMYVAPKDRVRIW